MGQPRWAGARVLLCAAVVAALAWAMPAGAQSSLLCACPDIDWDIRPQTSDVTRVLHEFNVEKVVDADMGKGFELVFFGDSITQHMREGSNWPVFQKYWTSKYRAYPLGVGNDQINNLNWRLRNGELPHTTPRVAVLLIGTNDIGAVESCTRNETDLLSSVPIINSRMRALLAYMRSTAPGMHIVILGILPRGAWSLPSQFAWPNRLTRTLAAINAASEALSASDGHIHYMDCSAGLTNATNVEASLLPDALHPNPAGYDLIFSCLAPVVDNLMRATAAADAAFAANVAAGVCPDPDEGKAAAAALLVGAAPGDITITASTAALAPMPGPAAAVAPATALAATLSLPSDIDPSDAGSAAPVWRNLQLERQQAATEQASSTVSLQATVDASSGSLLRPAFADATDEFGALILAQAPRTVDGVCAAAPAKQTGAAATSFAARVATTQRANAAAPGGCYLDC